MKTISNIRGLELRPLSARSAIASTLLGTHPPTLSAAVLVRSCEILGVAGGTARVALTRMVANGELTVADGHYSLVGSLLERQRRQDESADYGSDDDGRWSMFVVHPTAEPRSPAQRVALRTAFRNFRYATIRDGVWARPANLSSLSEASSTLRGHADHWMSTPNDPVATAANLWDLKRWAQDASQLRIAMSREFKQLQRNNTSALATNFALDAAVIRHLRSDPLLPPTLLPKSWPGETLRTEHAAFDAAFNRVWRSELRARRPAR